MISSWQGKQGKGFQGAKFEEIRACLFALQHAQAHGHHRLIIESVCLALIATLKKKEVPNSSLGFFISDIIALCSDFGFVLFNHIRRGCNSVVHAAGHF